MSRIYRRGWLTGLGFLLSTGCSHIQARPVATTRSPDPASLIEELVSFHTGILGDTVKIDACSILRATADETILTRLSPRTLASITSSRDCRGNTTYRENRRRVLLSLEQHPDSVVANIGAKNGHYVHIASYKAVPIQNTSRFGFASVTLHSFGTAGSAPPPAPPPLR